SKIGACSRMSSTRTFLPLRSSAARAAAVANSKLRFELVRASNCWLTMLATKTPGITEDEQDTVDSTQRSAKKHAPGSRQKVVLCQSCGFCRPLLQQGDCLGVALHPVSAHTANQPPHFQHAECGQHARHRQ